MKNTKFLLIYIGILLTIYTTACDRVTTSTSPITTQGLKHRFKIDGIIDFTGLNVQETDVSMNPFIRSGSAIGQTHVRWAFVNDDQSIYFAIEWQDNTYNNRLDFSRPPSDVDGVQLQFDNDKNGTLDIDDDIRVIYAAPGQGSMYIDQHVTIDNGNDSDLIGNGFGQLHYNASTQRYQAEFIFPMLPDEEAEDANLFLSPPYNIIFFDHVNLASSSGSAGSIFPFSRNSSSWPVLPVSKGGIYTHPQLPNTLGGLIVFVSTHEEANGEIYTFDPATRVVKRITHLPGLQKDSVSLSHDRTKVAFHGGPGETDYNAYEIYTINIDGKNLKRLTNNATLDAHPGWSPDDSRIVYASRRKSGGIGLVVMSEDGSKINELTPSPYQDGDPDYLPDGRIVCTTLRFSKEPQIRIAVMNENGNNIRQLSYKGEVSDHDPVGNNEKVYFERFQKNTFWATDAETPFVPWALVEVDLNTGYERTLLLDRWNNRLPIPDPSGQYIAYIKGIAHTAIHLIDLLGKDRGRLIPDITHILYFDWK